MPHQVVLPCCAKTLGAPQVLIGPGHNAIVASVLTCSTLPPCSGVHGPSLLPPLLCNQVGDSAPDVWLQLLERCASIPSCQPALIQDLGSDLVQQLEGMHLRDPERPQQASQRQRIITQLQQQTLLV